jgi:hypothetical protein
MIEEIVNTVTNQILNEQLSTEAGSMQRSSAEPIHRGFSWGQIRETLAEIAPSATPGNVADFRPARRSGPEAGPVEAEVSDAHLLINEAAAVVRQASEEVARIRAEAAERIQRKQDEVNELGRILKYTEEQLTAFESRYDEAAREAARLRAQAAEVERMRAEFERRFENDQRMIAFLERVVNDGKERVAASDERADAAEERARLLEGQLKSLVGTMRQKLLPPREAMGTAAGAMREPTGEPVRAAGAGREPAHDQTRGIGAIVAVIAFAALAASFLLNPTQSAQAGDLGSLRGVWGATCDMPSLHVGRDRVEFRGLIDGAVTGRFDVAADRVRFRSGSGTSEVDVQLVRRGENALLLTSASFGGVSVRPQQTLLLRCSLQPTAGAPAAT